MLTLLQSVKRLGTQFLCFTEHRRFCTTVQIQDLQTVESLSQQQVQIVQCSVRGAHTADGTGLI